MAYHLLVDGLLQPGTYHDLPVSMPMEGHEALFVLNAKAEALDVANKDAAAKEAASRARQRTAVAAAANEAIVARASTATVAAEPPAAARPSRAHPIGVPVPAARSAAQTSEAFHAALIAKGMTIDRRIESHLPLDYLELLRKHGAWLMALKSGEVKPMTSAQQSFVDVARGKTLPRAPLERAWNAYAMTGKRLGVSV